MMGATLGDISTTRETGSQKLASFAKVHETDFELALLNETFRNPLQKLQRLSICYFKLCIQAKITA